MKNQDHSSKLPLRGLSLLELYSTAHPLPKNGREHNEGSRKEEKNGQDHHHPEKALLEEGSGAPEIDDYHPDTVERVIHDGSPEGHLEHQENRLGPDAKQRIVGIRPEAKDEGVYYVDQ